MGKAEKHLLDIFSWKSDEINANIYISNIADQFEN